MLGGGGEGGWYGGREGKFLPSSIKKAVKYPTL